MALEARRLIRKMRGGAQAHLVEATDGNFYVVKFRNNPQHRRILVNELVAATLLDYLGIATPPAAVIELTEGFVAGNPELYIQLGSRREAVPAGRHFASRFPGNPFTRAVYDFLPDALLKKVANRKHFLGALVFDKWTANADSRQAIFFRGRLSGPPASDTAPERPGFVAQMMDHGYVFQGPHWEFRDSPLQGLYYRRAVYEEVRGWRDFEPWLERVLHFPEEVLDRALRRVPLEWLEDDEEELERLLEGLLRRRRRVADLIEQCRDGGRNPFPNWARALSAGS